jgi:hypothetical protein
VIADIKQAIKGGVPAQDIMDDYGIDLYTLKQIAKDL